MESVTLFCYFKQFYVMIKIVILSLERLERLSTYVLLSEQHCYGLKELLNFECI